MAEKTIIKRLDSGLTIWDAREEGKEIIGYSQDVQPMVNFTQSLANDEDYTKKGIKEGLWHYATIPDSVVLKLWFEDGINLYTSLDGPEEKKLWNLLNTKYKIFKTTSKHHSV
jgi:hypothetical protein